MAALYPCLSLTFPRPRPFASWLASLSVPETDKRKAKGLVPLVQILCDVAEGLHLLEWVLLVLNYKTDTIIPCLGQGSCWDGRRHVRS